MSVPMATSRPVAKGQRGPAPGGVTLGQEHNAQTRRVAAAVLEVLAGARTPGEAAVALGVSVPRYYQIESRALRGLLEACAPLPRGPGKDTAKEIARARQETQRLQRELGRQQALLRAAQRTIGLAAPPAAPPAGKAGKKPRKRRVARALSVATRLQQSTAGAAEPAAPTPS
jgi:hypothetical protein